MQVMLMCCIEEGRWHALPEAERDAVMKDYRDWVAEQERAGRHRATEKLADTAAAKTLRVRAGKAVVTDGPFAETKELIAGYTLIQVKSRDEAIEWAKRMPAPDGSGADCAIELRPLYELEDLGPSEQLERFRRLDMPSLKPE